LPSSASLGVSAIYDAAFAGSAIADLRQVVKWKHWGRSVRIRQFKVAGLEAAMAVRDTPTVHAVRIVAYRSQSEGIVYEFYLDGKPKNKTRDDAVLWAMVRGFALRPLP
jgi:hypothetical protein